MEDMPEHVEQLGHGGAICRHCGGTVDVHGYSMGGVVPASPAVNESGESSQMEMSEDIEDNARKDFVSAVKRSR